MSVTAVMVQLVWLLVQGPNTPGYDVVEISEPLQLLLKAIKNNKGGLFIIPLNDSMLEGREMVDLYSRESHWSYAVLSPSHKTCALLEEKPSERIQVVFTSLLRSIKSCTKDDTIAELCAAPLSSSSEDSWSHAFRGAALAADVCGHVLEQSTQLTAEIIKNVQDLTNFEVVRQQVRDYLTMHAGNEPVVDLMDPSLLSYEDSSVHPPTRTFPDLERATSRRVFVNFEIWCRGVLIVTHRKVKLSLNREFPFVRFSKVIQIANEDGPTLWIPEQCGEGCLTAGVLVLALLDDGVIPHLQLIIQFISGEINDDVVCGTLERNDCSEMDQLNVYGLISVLCGEDISRRGSQESFSGEDMYINSQDLDIDLDTSLASEKDDEDAEYESPVRKLLPDFKSAIADLNADLFLALKGGKQPPSNVEDCGAFVMLEIVAQAFPDESFITGNHEEARTRICISLHYGQLQYLVDGEHRLDLLEEHKNILDDPERSANHEKKADLTSQDFERLKPGQGEKSWFNDKLCNALVDLMHEKQQESKTGIVIAIMNSFYCTERITSQENAAARWLTKFKYDLVIVTKIVCPINIDNLHWGWVGIANRAIIAYDPFGVQHANRPEYWLTGRRLLASIQTLSAPMLKGADTEWINTAVAQLYRRSMHQITTSLRGTPSMKPRGILPRATDTRGEPHTSTVITSVDLGRQLYVDCNPKSLSPLTMRESICSMLAKSPPDIQRMMAQVYMADADEAGMTVNDGAQAYITKMKTPRVWGSDIELHEMAKLMNAPIMVYEHPIEEHFKLRTIIGNGLPKPPQFLCLTNNDRPELAHYVLLIPEVYELQLMAAQGIVHDEPNVLYLEYGPDIIKFYGFGSVGDGDCLFTGGDLMRLSSSLEHQPGGLSYREHVYRSLPAAGNVNQVAKQFRKAWQSGFCKAARHLILSDGHAFAETGLMYTYRLWLLRKRLV